MVPSFLNPQQVVTGPSLLGSVGSGWRSNSPSTQLKDNINGCGWRTRGTVTSWAPVTPLHHLQVKLYNKVRGVNWFAKVKTSINQFINHSQLINTLMAYSFTSHELTKLQLIHHNHQLLNQDRLAIKQPGASPAVTPRHPKGHIGRAQSRPKWPTQLATNWDQCDHDGKSSAASHRKCLRTRMSGRGTPWVYP